MIGSKKRKAHRLIEGWWARVQISARVFLLAAFQTVGSSLVFPGLVMEAITITVFCIAPHCQGLASVNLWCWWESGDGEEDKEEEERRPGWAPDCPARAASSQRKSEQQIPEDPFTIKLTGGDQNIWFDQVNLLKCCTYIEAILFFLSVVGKNSFVLQYIVNSVGSN